MREKFEKNENLDIVANNLEIIKSHFPHCFTKDGNLDFKKLESELSGEIDIVNEGFSLDWLGKSYAKVIANLETETVISPDNEHNSLEENKESNNVYIKGDNLDVLKHLVNTYTEKIRLLYIDPPYNTGDDDFVYEDNFSFTPELLSNLANVEIEEAIRILEFTERKSNSHSAWLTFMFPRLFIARELLENNGVVFISIDDNEQANLKLLCDEIFGEQNFIAKLVHKNNSNKNQANLVGVSTEYVFVYAKNFTYLKDIIWRIEKRGVNDVYRLYSSLKEKGYNDEDILSEVKDMYKRPKYAHLSRWNKIDDRGIFKDADLSREGGRTDYTIINPHTNEPCVIPSRGWGKSYEDLLDLQEKDLIYYGDSDTPPGLKDYINAGKESVPDNFLFYDNAVDTRFIREEFGGLVFDNPKPVEMISQFVKMHCNDGTSCLVLDFFGGSSTTAHAVLSVNAEKKNNNIKFIIVQIPVPPKKGSVADKMGYRTICDIGIERIKRAAAKIKKETKAKIDYGFKIFETKLISDKIKENDLSKMKSFTGSTISDETILNQFGKETVLTTWMLEDGHALTINYEKVNLGEGYIAYKVENTLYLLDGEFTLDINLKSLIEKVEKEANVFKINKIVLFGYSFATQTIASLQDNMRHLRNGRSSADIHLEVRY